MIEVLHKIWRPRQENKYRVPDYSDDIDGIIFYYKVYAKSIFKPNLSWESGNIDYVIVFDNKLLLEDLIKHMRVGYTVEQPREKNLA